MASRFFQSGARQQAATSDKKADRRAALIEHYGSSASALLLINEIVDAEKEVAGTRRGPKEDRTERRRERRLWLERIDARIKKLEELRDAESPDQDDLYIATDDLTIAKTDILLDVDPDAVARATAYISIHEPAWLSVTCPTFCADLAGDELNKFRMMLFVQRYAKSSELDKVITSFHNSLCDAEGNEPEWLTDFKKSTFAAKREREGTRS